MEDVDQLVTAYISQHFPEGFEMALIAGNSIHADKAFISYVFEFCQGEMS